ncbi:hypothetical protein Busp01_48610 [Trinickia caryophylli]|nr:transglutaminase domain-containing protein [Trinickia caryophylli]GLU35019.1 hypothetical protein Busp01_48610 [Trinickia caryophylli]
MREHASQPAGAPARTTSLQRPQVPAHGIQRSGEVRGGCAAPGGRSLAGGLRSVRNTFVRLRDADAGRIFDMRRQSRDKELRSMHAASASQRGIGTKDIGLAAYLTARSTLHRTIDGPELPSLRKANDTVTKTRALLSHGRGNVATDLAKTQEPFWRTRFGRMKAKSYRGDLAAAGALAIKMKAGNCGEHANVATVSHARKLGEGETLQFVSGAGVDHAWAENKLPDGGRVVLDAWAEGPAIMSEDSRFSQRETSRNVYASFSLDAARALAEQKDKHLESFERNPDLDKQWEDFKTEAAKKKLAMSKRHVFAPTPVVSQAFQTAVGDQQKEAARMARRTRKEARLTSSSTAHVALGNEIKAVGAARALGANVKQSLQSNEPILAAVKKQFTK